jgi:hypothetical protein
LVITDHRSLITDLVIHASFWSTRARHWNGGLAELRGSARAPDLQLAPDHMRTITWRTTTLGAAAFLLGTIAAGSGSLRAAWEPIARFASLQDPPKAASANVLSEHEITALAEMLPQQQAELLLERAINHYSGANNQISARVDSWRGRITLNGRLNHLFSTAINSDDLTVRVAGIEVDIAARNLTKDSATVDRLEPIARSGEQGPRVNALWDLALVGNRGVEPDRVADILLSAIHDRNVNIRYWAVEGLAYHATDAAIAPLLDVFHDDPAANIRERAACSLAQSGSRNSCELEYGEHEEVHNTEARSLGEIGGIVGESHRAALRAVCSRKNGRCKQPDKRCCLHLSFSRLQMPAAAGTDGALASVSSCLRVVHFSVPSGLSAHLAGTRNVSAVQTLAHSAADPGGVRSM